jgi:2'-5' RNA ligase
MSLTRTFIAVAASDSIRHRAEQAIDRLCTVAKEVRWVEPDNMHWTLQFLGDLDDRQMAEVCRRVVATAGQIDPFSLVAQGVGAFPRPERPRTLWLGAGEGAGAFCHLQSAIEECLVDLGFRGERRKFVPHLTLGRLGKNQQTGERLTSYLSELASCLSELVDFEAGSMEVGTVAVMASQLQRGRGRGPIYHVLAQGALATK